MASTSYRLVTHCIFDMDGLLLDTESIYFECFDDILKEFGHRYSHQMANKLRGTSRAISSKMTIEEYNLPLTSEQFLEKLDAILAPKMANCRLMPGANRLIRHLHKHNVPIAIATGSSLEYVQIKTEKNHKEFMALFRHLVSGTDDPDVKQNKPAPDIFLVCAKRFSPPLEGSECGKALVFEDAPNGVRAAVAAGMQVVMVPDPLAVTDEQRKEATLCLDSLESFQPELFGLPPFDE